MITGLLIGGLVGLITSVPAAVVYSKKTLENEENMIESPSLVRTSSATEPIVTDTARIGRVEVKATSVYRNEKQDKAMFDLVFKIVEPNVPQTGIGIIDPVVTWVHATRNNKTKQVSDKIFDSNVYLLQPGEEHKVKASLEDQKNMLVSHVKMKIYEGGVGKTHNIQLKIEDYSYVDR